MHSLGSAPPPPSQRDPLALTGARMGNPENVQGQLSGGYVNRICMQKRRFFPFYIQIYFSEKYPGARERLLTSHSVKKGRWVYDRGECAHWNTESIALSVLFCVVPLPLGAVEPSCKANTCPIVAKPPSVSRTTDMRRRCHGRPRGGAAPKV